MDYELSKHAHEVMLEREIAHDWLERTLFKPELILPDPDDQKLRRYFCRISECENKVLRVVVNVQETPLVIVTVFFDRSMKGKL